MAKAEKEVKENIKDLALLRKEFERGQMPMRKMMALRQKLVELHVAGNITSSEKDMMIIILKRDRVKGGISDYHSEILNRIEVEKCEEEAYVKVDNAPRVHFLSKDQICRYFKDTDKDRFVVFVERSIPPEWQMTTDLLMKEMRGHFAPEDQYPKERKLLHRLDLTEKEFHAWFYPISNDELKAEKQEENYTF
jgi:hypothetical protein